MFQNVKKVICLFLSTVIAVSLLSINVAALDTVSNPGESKKISYGYFDSDIEFRYYKKPGYYGIAIISDIAIRDSCDESSHLGIKYVNMQEQFQISSAGKNLYEFGVGCGGYYLTSVSDNAPKVTDDNWYAEFIDSFNNKSIKIVWAKEGTYLDPVNGETTLKYVYFLQKYGYLYWGDRELHSIKLTLMDYDEKEKVNLQISKNVSYYPVNDIPDQTYTGKAIKPEISFDGYKLFEGFDYKTKYKDNKKIGKATVTIKGTGEYKGSQTISFKILPAQTTLKAKKEGNKIKLSWKSVKGIDKYQISISTDGGKSFRNLGTVEASKTSITPGKLKASDSYVFKIRAYKTVNGKKYYSLYSDEVTYIA